MTVVACYKEMPASSVPPSVSKGSDTFRPMRKREEWAYRDGREGRHPSSWAYAFAPLESE